MQELPNQITHLLPEESICLNTEVVRIERLGKQWQVTAKDDSGIVQENTLDQVICAVPTHQLQKIEWLGLHGNEWIEGLANSTHFPLALVYHGYEKSRIAHPLNGFGFLVPEVENRKILGTLFSSTLFPDRAPADHALLTTFVGGERQPELAKLEDRELHSLVCQEHQSLLGTSGTPSFQKIVRWPRAIPLPDSKMTDRKRAAQQLETLNPGLQFVGSHLCGVSLPNCLDSGNP